MRQVASATALLLAALLASSPAGAQLVPEEAALKSHVQFLAADEMRGRESGTHEYDIAAEYVAAQMTGIGLAPAGEDGGWFQPLQLVSYRATDRGKAAITLRRARVELNPGADFLLFANPAAPETRISGAVVFAGYGLVDPDAGRDDYAGLDVRGKIVALLAGLPEGMPNEVAAHFGDGEARARLAQARGAKGVVLLETPMTQQGTPFTEVSAYWDYLQGGWAAPDGRVHTATPDAPLIGLLSVASAEKLFANARLRWGDVVAAERNGKAVPRGALASTFEATVRTQVTRVATRNVIGRIEGSDPALRGEHIVLSAHLDHVGVGQEVRGDRIYNGALDNALGVATILEVARAFKKSGKRPRRSILFVALAAEEKGLIGSSYFVNRPTVPRESIVANINIDMPIITYPLQDLVVLGSERSSMGAAFEAAAAAEGLKLVPDPAPEEMFFIRSDHYSFVKAGVPAVSVDSGPGGPGEAAQRAFLANHYHKPSDDLSLPIDWAAAVKFARVNYAAARVLADGDARPRWNKGDFFGVTFAGFGAR